MNVLCHHNGGPPLMRGYPTCIQLKCTTVSVIPVPDSLGVPVNGLRGAQLNKLLELRA